MTAENRYHWISRQSNAKEEKDWLYTNKTHASASKTAVVEEDLLDIWCYIAQDNPDAADAWIDQLGETAWRLAENPQMGRLREALLPDIRSFPVGNYILFYQPLEAGIELIRVLNAHRDLEALLQ